MPRHALRLPATGTRGIGRPRTVQVLAVLRAPTYTLASSNRRDLSSNTGTALYPACARLSAVLISVLQMPPSAVDNAFVWAKDKAFQKLCAGPGPGEGWETDRGPMEALYSNCSKEPKA